MNEERKIAERCPACGFAWSSGDFNFFCEACDLQQLERLKQAGPSLALRSAASAVETVDVVSDPDYPLSVAALRDMRRVYFLGEHVHGDKMDVPLSHKLPPEQAFAVFDESSPYMPERLPDIICRIHRFTISSPQNTEGVEVLIYLSNGFPVEQVADAFERAFPDETSEIRAGIFRGEA